ncbi:hypothetical protein HG535_0G00640 [Zygotorulaspora mrakii]|uniref:Uncharacterized protein n=1 Tax=Zygotorulaspora mrakii TaxID=42260 RepID=A0A7H9B6M5_ZYGMR|nr:uncharacterized protein HG535_0G00640 [Zygotorulaspora mrakii]QLG74180.1 hypothetical protein HG535_0G00640 [Zygotorulaspora mrakii]
MTKIGSLHLSVNKTVLRYIALVFVVALLLNKIIPLDSVINGEFKNRIRRHMRLRDLRHDTTLTGPIISKLEFDVDPANPFSAVRLIIFVVLCFIFVLPFCLD